MLGRRDKDCIDVFVFEKIPIVKVGLRVRCELFRVFETAGVDIGEANKLGVGAGYRFASDLRTAITDSDDAQSNAVIGSEYAARRGERDHAGRGDGPEEVTA